MRYIKSILLIKMSDDEYDNNFYEDDQGWNSDDGNYQDNYEWDEPDMLQPEFAALQRVGLPGQTGIYLGGKRDVPMRGIDRAMQDPLERFQEYVDSIARNLRTWDDVSIDDTDIEILFLKSRDLKDVGYKNPTAYILGYIASNGGRTLNDPKSKGWSNALIALKHVDDTVLEPDIIRYARLWLRLA